MSDKLDNPRRSGRIVQAPVRFGDAVPTVSRRRTVAPKPVPEVVTEKEADAPHPRHQKTLNVSLEEGEIRDDDSAKSEKSFSTWKSTSKASRASSISRRKKEADVEAMRKLLNIDEEQIENEMELQALQRQQEFEDFQREEELQRRKKQMTIQLKQDEINRRKKIAERQKEIVQKELELAKSIIDDDNDSKKLSDDDEREWEQPEVPLPPDDVAPKDKTTIWVEKQEEKVPTPEIQQTPPPFKKSTTENVECSPKTAPMEEVRKDSAEPDRFDKFLARQTLAKELPVFFGDPIEWPNFISQYRATTEACRFTNIENIARLQKCLKGKAKESVQCMMALPENLEEVMECLESNFGRPDIILKMLTDKAERMPSVKEEKPEALIDLANAVRNLTSTAAVLKRKEYLSNPHLMEKLTEKLSPALRREWGMKILTMGDDTERLKIFSSWIYDMARAVRAVTIPQNFSSAKDDKKDDKNDDRSKGRGRRRDVVAAVGGDSSRACLFCKKSNHHVTECRKFAKEDLDKKWQWVTSEKLCFCCLQPGHRSGQDCLKSKKCGKDGCDKLHHSILHRTIPKPRKEEAHKTSREEEQLVSHASEEGKVLLCLLPVLLKGPAGEINTFAMLDSGATVTLLDSDVARKIGASGPKVPLSMQWIDSTTQNEPNSQLVQLKVQGAKCRTTYDMKNVRTIDNLSLRGQSVNGRKMKTEWRHLRSIDFPDMQNAQPKMLIGLDNASLILALEAVEGPLHAPIAVKTRLGWTVHGNDNQVKGRVDNNIVLHVHKKDEELHQLIKNSFRLEDLGVKVREDDLLSREDKRTQELTEKTTIKVGDQWETGLLWKNDVVILPESKTMALNRLHNMERKMDRNPEFAKEYCAKMETYFTKGFAKKLTDVETIAKSPKTWYLPHFLVYNPNKPDKPRLVFDAAAKSRGVSLNDTLLKGMDLLRPLTSVLCKFRQREIAFGGDIKDMFHKVKIRNEDLPAQRFLWRGMKRDEPPSTCQMNVMIFGAVSSPYSAQEVKNRNARSVAHLYSENAVTAIIDRHYMDDYLDSCSTVSEAQDLIREVIKIHKSGGFDICNWICNDERVLKVVPVELRAPTNSNLSLEDCDEDIKIERVLGLFWNPERDVFQFTKRLARIDPEILEGRRIPTKRETLSIVMSVFDPLGFLTHFTIKARILLQDVWRSNTKWDQELPPHASEKWTIWMEELKNIDQFEIPRCYNPKMSSNTVTTLHVFCDASPQAYAAVAYLRMEEEETVKTALVMAKARVAPIKPVSVPRMELQAALLGARMSKSIVEQHEIEISAVQFWTDSKTVLLWVRSDGRSHKPFVAHRIGEITELTDVTDWRWVPTKENVADEATKDGVPTNLCAGSRWLLGPKFLKEPQSEWPKEISTRQLKAEVDEDDLELRKEWVGSVTISHASHLPDIRRFSSWIRLIRATAWMLRAIRKWKRKNSDNNMSSNGQRQAEVVQELSVNEMEEAELVWLKAVQQSSFPEEIHCLQIEKELPNSSKTKSLNPIINERGLLVLKGRLSAVDGEGILKQPILLDSQNAYTKLLLLHLHRKAGHHGLERVLNDARQKYWILGMRAAVKEAWKKCQWCKIRKVKPENPEIGQLPHFRVNRQERPFTYTGLDYFGPMDVTIGRRREKRYGALFTCLTTRAVHLELAGSLDTDSCINAIRVFMARRGAPKQIQSDNGTNFHGANNELKRAIEELNQEELTRHLAIKGVDWKFIPPSAPYMGGSWERLVRLVKIALKATLQERTPKEDTLRTLLAEAEHTVNSRPLTHVSVDPEDSESLTPNHFLLGGPSKVNTPGVFDSSDLWTRRHWRTAQRLADMYWKRWIKEYLPTLTRRTKEEGKHSLVKVGDLVFIADGDLPRNMWPRGVVEKVFPGKDGVVRVVDVKTNTGTCRRPTVKICVLDVKSEVNVPLGYLREEECCRPQAVDLNFDVISNVGAKKEKKEKTEMKKPCAEQRKTRQYN